MVTRKGTSKDETCKLRSKNGIKGTLQSLEIPQGKKFADWMKAAQDGWRPSGGRARGKGRDRP